jgi:hypothetical protein
MFWLESPLSKLQEFKKKRTGPGKGYPVMYKNEKKTSQVKRDKEE